MKQQSTYLIPWRCVAIVYAVAMTIGTHWPNLRLVSEGGPTELAGIGLDKWIHWGAYFGLFWTMALARWTRGYERFGEIILLVGLCLFSVLDEATQGWVPGRSVSWIDWGASVGGLFSGAMIWQVYRRWMIYDPHRASFVAHTRLVSALTVFSRCFGLVRDALLAMIFGMGPMLDIWVIGFLVPNLFRRLFGEGALSAAFIPRYTALASDQSSEQNQAAAGRLARLILSRFVFGLILLVIGAMTVMWVLEAFNIGSSSDWPVIRRLVQVTLWYAPMICAVAILGGMLQVYGRFGFLAISPVILNMTMIAAAIIYYVYLKPSGATAGDALQLLAGALLCAGLIQLIIQWWGLHRVTPGWWHQSVSESDHQMARQSFKQVVRQWGPATLGLAVLQVNTLLDVVIAKIFSGAPNETVGWLGGGDWIYPLQDGDVGVLSMATRLYEFPLGVFGIAVATAIFPALASAAKDQARFVRLIRQGIRLTLFIGLPASVGLILVRRPLAQAIFAPAGELVVGDAARIASVLIAYGTAIWAYSLNQMLTRIFYAKEDVMRPVRVSVAMVGVNLCLNLILIWPLGAEGLAWSTAICAIGQSFWLMWLLRHHAAGWWDQTVGRSIGQTFIAAVGMGVCVGGVMWWWDAMATARWITIIGVIGLSALGALVFAAFTRLLKMDELTWLLSRHGRSFDQ